MHLTFIMKWTLAFSGFLLFSFALHSQNCPVGDIIFSSQTQIDNFITEYPDCTTIAGRVEITGDITSLAGLGNITKIEENLYLLDNSPVENLNGLNNLDTILGTFYINDNSFITTYDGLDNLLFVGGNLIIQGNTVLTDIDALNSLEAIGRTMNINDNISLESINCFENISTINNHLYIWKNPVLSNIEGLQNLVSVGQDLTISENPSLVSLPALNSLVTVGNTLDIRNNNLLVNLEGLNSLISVGETLFIVAMENLTSLEGLNSLSYVERLSIVSNPSLTNLEGLDNLIEVDINFNLNDNDQLMHCSGLESLVRIGRNLRIDGNLNLIDLEGLNNIDTIGFDIEIMNNLALSNLAALDGLSQVNGSLVLRGNAGLNSLLGIHNVALIGRDLIIDSNNALQNLDDLQSIASINRDIEITDNLVLEDISALGAVSFADETIAIEGNPLLSDCSYALICNHIDNGGETSIFGNLDGCNSEVEIIANCFGLGFSGFAFYDFNQNQVRDNFESGIPMQRIYAEPQNEILFTNSSGRYLDLCEEGEAYTFNYIENPDWSLNTDSSSFSTTFEAFNPENQGNNFGLFPNFSNHNFSISTNSGQPRCNTDVPFFVQVCNEGTFLEEGAENIEIRYSDLADFVSAIPAPVAINLEDRILTWEYDSLYPFQCDNFQLVFTMPGVDFIGEFVELESTVYRDSLGVSVVATQDLFETEVLCSYDPNDKLVLPRGVQDENYTLKDEEFQYTIRFQNTGNISAIDVTLRDTLDANLDWNTFRVIHASHEVQTSLTDNGEVAFYFRDINLPDSLSNPIESQGFVQYAISPEAGLPDNTIIENTAYIYFDFNPPIITNTTFNTLVDEIPTATNNNEINEGIIKIYPNPTDGILYLSGLENLNPSNYRVEITSTSGRFVKKSYDLTSSELDLSELPSGVYGILIRDVRSGKILDVDRILVLP